MRAICERVNKALVATDGLFADTYEADIQGDLPSVAPEKQLRANLLEVLCSVRSERMLMAQIHYNMRFRWFVGLSWSMPRARTLTATLSAKLQKR